MSLPLTEPRIENMMNHLYAYNIDARWWRATDDSIHVEIDKLNKEKEPDYYKWMKTWFSATTIAEETDANIEFILGV